MYLLFQIVIFHGKSKVNLPYMDSYGYLGKLQSFTNLDFPYYSRILLRIVGFFLMSRFSLRILSSTQLQRCRFFLFLSFRSFCDPILQGEWHLAHFCCFFFGLNRVTQIRAIKLDWSLTNAFLGLVIYCTDHWRGRISWWFGCHGLLPLLIPSMDGPFKTCEPIFGACFFNWWFLADECSWFTVFSVDQKHQIWKLLELALGIKGNQRLIRPY